MSNTKHPMRHFELRIPPLAVTVFFAAVMVALAYVIPATLSVPAKALLAVALVLAGALVALLGIVAFHKQQTTVNPLLPERVSSLVATGIYHYSRNPMYLGFLLVLMGLCVFLANWASAVLLPVFVIYMNRLQIQPEERALAAKFGPAFVAYTKSVRRWL